MGYVIGELVGWIEKGLVWLLLWLVLTTPPTFENVADRQLTDLANEWKLSPRAPEKIRSQLLIYLRERDLALSERRKATHEKLKTLLTISSALVAVLGALSVADLLDDLIIFPLTFFAACSFLLVHYVADDNWSGLSVFDDDIERFRKDVNAWDSFEIRGRERAWRHNEEVRGFLTKVYTGARRYFLLGFFSLLALTVWMTFRPENVAPQDVAPQNVAPQNVAPQNVAPQNVAPQSADPHNVAPQKELTGGMPSIEGDADSEPSGAADGEDDQQTAPLTSVAVEPAEPWGVSNDDHAAPCGGLETILCDLDERASYQLSDPAIHDLH